MPDSTQVREFLEGGAIAVEPAGIEPALAALWRPAAEQAAGDDLPPVTRVSLGTQVVVTEAAREAEVGALWTQLAERHPSRAIVVVVEPGDRTTVEAAISASCHLPAPGEPQVCSERIQLRLGASQLQRLPGAVLPLLEPDVPATLWWDLRTPPSPEVCRQLGREVDRCLLDLTRAVDPAATWRALRDAGCEAVADLAWFRAARWREGAARLFDGVAHAATLAAIERVTVVGAAANPGEIFPAALLAGWVAGQLGWQPLERFEAGPQLPDGDEQVVCITRWRRAGGDGVVRLARRTVGDGRPGRLQALQLHAPTEAAAWQLERLRDRPRELRIAAHHEAWCQLPYRLPAPRPALLDVLLHALDSPPRTPVRDRALRHATWLLGWSDPGPENPGT